MQSVIRTKTEPNQMRRKSSRLNRFRRRSGVTAAEFAMIAPVFIFVIAVCVEFARLSMMRNLAQHAAYEASRFILAEGATIGDGITRANQILGRLGTRNAKITINGSDGKPGQGGVVPNQITANTVEVTCRIEIPLKDNSLVIPPSFLGNNITASSISLRTERYRGFYDGQSVN